MGEQEHWERVHGQRAADEVSWYRPHLDRSMSFIAGAGLAKNAAIVDVGGGASTLVDDLLGQAYSGEFGAPFKKVASCEEVHLTPWGKEQEFVYCYCRMLG